MIILSLFIYIKATPLLSLLRFYSIILIGDLMKEKYILKINEDGSKIYVHDVHKVLLEMLKDIDRICKKYDIKYFLTAGTCLGAIRHNGFIPWDDDADIAMMREDYEKLVAALQKELPNDKYYFQCFDTHKEYNVLIPIMKIRKKGTYVEEVNTLLKNKCKDGDGIFIDVFLVDYINKNKWIDFPCRLLTYVFMCIIIVLENLGINPYFIKKLFVKYSRFYSDCNSHSEYIGYDLNWVFNSPFKPIIFKKEDVYPLKYHTFEDAQFLVPKNTKEYLDAAIGVTHMTPPPIDKRKPKHIKDIQI